MITATQDMQIVGLIIDALGVLMLLFAAISKITTEIAAQSTPYWDFSSEIAMALAAFRVDIATGSLFMITGFVIQAIGSLGYIFLGEVGVILLTATVLLVVVYLLVLRKIACAFIVREAQRLQQASVYEKDPDA